MRKPAPGSHNPDPVFQAEMAAVLEERRAAFVGDFRERWAERIKRSVAPAVAPTVLHRHDESCFEGQETVRQDATGTFYVGRPCTRSSGSFVIRTAVPLAEGRRLGLVSGYPVPEGRVP